MGRKEKNKRGKANLNCFSSELCKGEEQQTFCQKMDILLLEAGGENT